jgi:hypothetical protein
MVLAKTWPDGMLSCCWMGSISWRKPPEIRKTATPLRCNEATNSLQR